MVVVIAVDVVANVQRRLCCECSMFVLLFSFSKHIGLLCLQRNRKQLWLLVIWPFCICICCYNGCVVYLVYVIYSVVAVAMFWVVCILVGSVMSRKNIQQKMKRKN